MNNHPNNCSNLKVLVISDDPNNRAFIERILFDNRGIKVISAIPDQQILAEAEQAPLDIIIIEATLPEPYDVFQIYQQIRAKPELQKTPVLFWRVSNPWFTCPKAQAAGVAGCLEFMASYDKDTLLAACDALAEGGSYYPSLD